MAPLVEIPAHTCTLNGCFAVGFIFAGWPTLRKHSLLCLFSQMLLSSVKTTFSKVSFSSAHFLTNSSSLTRLASLKIWRYRVPDFRHPILYHVHLTVLSENYTLNSSYSNFCKPIKECSSAKYWARLINQTIDKFITCANVVWFSLSKSWKTSLGKIISLDSILQWTYQVTLARHFPPF